MKKIFLIVFLAGLIGLTVGLSPALAYQIEENPDMEVKGDFLLGPGKMELWLDPGESVTRTISITNRLGKEMTFRVEIEDFTGSRDPTETIRLLGEEKGPYSLRDYLKPEVKEFTLAHGQRIVLPVEISIPQDAEPGGRYGAVIIATTPPKTEEGEEKEPRPAVVIIARLANLFFVRVKGEVIEDGFLKEFKTERRFYEKGPIPFELLSENNGNVHLAPYGLIEIYNILGRKVDEIELDPWFAMPDSLRLRETKWNRDFLFGRYTALASVNRGYQDIIDQKSINFWVVPWKIILAGLVMLFLVIWFFRWIFSKFEIKRKTPLVP